MQPEKEPKRIATDERTKLVAVTGNTPEKLQEFCQTFQVRAIDSWNRLIRLPELDLVFYLYDQPGGVERSPKQLSWQINTSS